ncbi:peptidoglycan-binding protein [Streptomyces sp. NPDC057616]|uniref:peptidoglycan-binding protein n=1 Tax=Streptomyces sp. NPDC057616 TaxID=3346183 RepID=UPI003682D01A
MSEVRGSAYARELTDLLQRLKSRADCSYEALARRSGVSGSALHRYCSGAGVPNDFDPVARFGKACGADAQELLELHRLWVLVDAGRRRGGPATTVTTTNPETTTAATTAATAGTTEATGAEATEPPATSPDSPAPDGDSLSLRPSYRRLLRRLRRWPVVLGALLVIGATVTGAALLTGGSPAGADESRDRPLLTAKCRFVAMGHQDSCVRELQLRLQQAGLDLEVDGAFGPITQMRVVVFQLLAGLEADGAVDDRTKRALYSGRVKAHPWSPARVDRRIREVFTEDADRASGIAKCASNLDPLYSLGNSNGTRNWGVFQLYDGTLRTLGGTPRKALDPEWNIQAAHRLWARTHDFRAWQSCDQAYRAGASKAKPATSKGP